MVKSFVYCHSYHYYSLMVFLDISLISNFGLNVPAYNTFRDCGLQSSKAHGMITISKIGNWKFSSPEKTGSHLFGSCSARIEYLMQYICGSTLFKIHPKWKPTETRRLAAALYYPQSRLNHAVCQQLYFNWTHTHTKTYRRIKFGVLYQLLVSLEIEFTVPPSYVNKDLYKTLMAKLKSVIPPHVYSNSEWNWPCQPLMLCSIFSLEENCSTKLQNSFFTFNSKKLWPSFW